MVARRYICLDIIIALLLVGYTSGLVIKDRYDVCLIAGEISKTDEIENCVNIKGHLHFKSGISGRVKTSNIRNITGCLIMENTNITDLNFLKEVTFECDFPYRHIIRNNPNLCVEESLQKTLKEDILKQERDIYFQHSICPACTRDNYNENCRMLIGDYIAGKHPFTSMKKLQVIRGQLLVQDVDNKMWFEREEQNNPDLLRRRLFVYSFSNATVPAVHIINSAMPQNIFFLNLEIQTHGPVALNVSITGYKMPRSLHRKLSVSWPHKKIEVDAEELGECSVFEDENGMPYELDDLLRCEKVIGQIHFDTTLVKSPLRTTWANLITNEQNITFSGGRNMSTLFRKRVPIYYSHPNFRFEIYFVEDDLCLDAIIMTGARTWLDSMDRYRVRYTSAPNCTHYYGSIDFYNMRFEDAEKMTNKTVNGVMMLNSTELRAYEKKDGDKTFTKWERNIERFGLLKKVIKTINYPFNTPVVHLSYCGPTNNLPEWLFTLPILSEREDDLLLKIEGPGFKVTQDVYEKLSKTFPKERMDVDVADPSECLFFEPISKMHLLDNCKYIVGDLILNETTQGTTIGTIKYVSGCIHITNTSLTNLDFLDFEVPYSHRNCFQCKGLNGFAIIDNKKMCVYHKKFRTSRKYVHGNKHGCGSELRDNEIHDGSVIIHMNDNEESHKNLKSIKEINGRVYVIGSFAEKLNIFPNLVRINWMGDGPALIVENNANLTAFELPRLMEINVKHKNNAIRFRNNPKLILNATEERRYKKATLGDVSFENEVADDEYNSNMPVGIGIGLGVGAGTVLLAAFTAGVVFGTHKLVGSIKNKINKKKLKKNNVIKKKKDSTPEEESQLITKRHQPKEDEVTSDDAINKKTRNVSNPDDSSTIAGKITGAKETKPLITSQNNWPEGVVKNNKKETLKPDDSIKMDK